MVLLHGCLSDHRTWRFVQGALGEDHCLVLVDLPGCGDSDKPHPASLGPKGYSPDAQAERVMQALGTHLGGRDQRPITLVGHSLGGAIILRSLGSDELRSRHGGLLRRVDRIVLVAPADLEFVNPPLELRRLAEADPVTFVVGDFFGVLRKEVARATLNSVDNPDRALCEDADRMIEILREPDSCRAVQATLRQTIPNHDGRPDWDAIDRLIDDYANVDVPCLLLWGEHDETIPVAKGYKLAFEIPDAELYVMDDCRHSPHLEYPVRFAEIVRSFSITGSAAFLEPVNERIAEASVSSR